MKFTSLAALRAALVVSSAMLVLIPLYVTAALTNWFRYPMSLEAELVLLPLMAIVPVAIGVHVWAFRTMQRNRVAPFIAIALLVVAVVVTTVRSHAVFGAWLPRVGADDIDRNGDQFLRSSAGSTITYHLELHNPFGWSAKTYLVGTFGDRPFKVSLPIGRIDAYGDAITPSDWVTLSSTSRPNIVVATVGVVPNATYRFTVDLDSETASQTQLKK